MKIYDGPLAYYSGKKEIGDKSFRISASGISRFFSHTRQWWGESFLNEEGFVSSTASVLGTITHRIAELHARNGEVTEQDYKDIEEYIDVHTIAGWDKYNIEVDAEIIRYQYPIMGQALVSRYLKSNPPEMIEPFLYHEELKGIGGGGSIDNVSKGESGGLIIVDYKTSSATSLPDKIVYAYRLQLLTYAYLLTKKGHSVKEIRIVYVSRNNVGRVSEKTGKPLKQYPTKVKVITESINEQDLEYIERVIKLIAESVDCWNKQPEMRHLLCQDLRQKKPKNRVKIEQIEDSIF